MGKELAVAPQREGDIVSTPKPKVKGIPVISSDSHRKMFSDLTDLFQEHAKQISNSKKIIKKLIGNSDKPGSLWETIECYGDKIGNDLQECHVQNDGKIWSIKRINPVYKWNTSSALQVMKLAHTVSAAEVDSPEQKVAFDAFKDFLEKASGELLDLTPGDWWGMIDDASDLYKTSIVKTVAVEALELAKDALSPVLVKVLCVRIEPEYTVYVKNAAGKVDFVQVTCCTCHNTIDSEDFFCRFCGTITGIE